MTSKKTFTVRCTFQTVRGDQVSKDVTVEAISPDDAETAARNKLEADGLDVSKLVETEVI